MIRYRIVKVKDLLSWQKKGYKIETIAIPEEKALIKKIMIPCPQAYIGSVTVEKVEFDVYGVYYPAQDGEPPNEESIDEARIFIGEVEVTNILDTKVYYECLVEVLK